MICVSPWVAKPLQYNFWLIGWQVESQFSYFPQDSVVGGESGQDGLPAAPRDLH
jgi:hypothetical protein